MVDVARYTVQPKMVLFTVIGIFNTMFDVALYTVMRSAGQSVVASNLVSASAALIGSYLLNSRVTFKSRRWTIRHFAGFVVVTLVGLWVLQTAAIYWLALALRPVPRSFWAAFGPLRSAAEVAAPKLLATGVTFVWNYTWYNKVVFRELRALPNG